jgi:hypothetical protein
VFSEVKPFSNRAKKWVQRVDNGIAIEDATNAQTIGFVKITLQVSSFKWYAALTSSHLDNQDWEVLKTKPLQ